MLRIWTGRARSGKSEAVLQAIRELGDGSRQLLIVPQYATHETETELCRACGDTVSRHAEVLSFESLAERVLASAGGLGTELDGGGKLLTMQRTLQEVGGKLRFFRRSFLKSAFLTSLISLADEFRNYRVTPEQLMARAEEIGGETGKKLQDLALITGVYEAKLQSGGADARDRVSRMAELLPDAGYVRDADIFLDGISYFNAQEERALSVMLRQSRTVTVTMLFDPQDRSGIFDDTAATIGRLRMLARENGAQVETRHFEAPQADGPLPFLERHFFGGNEAYEGDCAGAVSVLSAPSAYAEAEAVAAEIRRLTREGYRYRDIGVVARNLEEYRGTLETVFRRYGIPCYLDERSDILEKPLMTLLCAALEAVSGGYEYEDMFRWLKTGLGPLSDAECDILENYVIRWEIRGSMWIRETDWTAHPEGYGARWTEESQAALQRVNELRRRVRQPLAALAEGLKNAACARDMVTAVYRFLEALEVPQQLETRVLRFQQAGELQSAEEYSQLWNILCGVMDQFVEILGDSPMETAEFSRLFRLILTQYRVGTIPVALDQVKVGAMTQNDRKTVKCLFLMGANDGVIPAPVGAAGLLTEEDRELMSAGGIRLAPGAEGRFILELQNLYAALAQPTERIMVSYPTADVAGSELRPAFVVSRLKKLFPGLSLRQASEADAAAAPLPALQAAGSWKGGRLWRYFAEKEAYAEALAAMDRAAAVERGRLSREAVELLYGSRLRMSASRMDKVRQCHYAYFLQYGLKAKKREVSSFDAPEIGTFLHYLLENVTKEAQKRGGFAKVEQAELRRLTALYTERYAEEELGGLQEKNARFRYLFRRLRELAERIVESLAAELAESDFVPLAFELTFSDGGDIPAITISEGDKELQVVGKVDRVDGWLHEGRLYLRVVDYKTGRKSFDLADVRYGLNLQMLLYLFTLQSQGESRFGYPIEPAGVLYMPARDTLLRQSRNIGEEALRHAFEKEMTRSGLVLSDPAVLRAMEHSALESPCYLPVRVKKDGSLSGSLADAEMLGSLGRHVERQLRAILREMAAGTVDADPCCRSEEETACRYCDFSAACHFEDGRGGDHLRYIRPVTTEEFWAEMRQNGEGGEV
ncbi:MAG: PD-(D/E)XK nuclease family protein [Oscillospiraceae bacterium]